MGRAQKNVRRGEKKGKKATKAPMSTKQKKPANDAESY